MEQWEEEQMNSAFDTWDYDYLLKDKVSQVIPSFITNNIETLLHF